MSKKGKMILIVILAVIVIIGLFILVGAWKAGVFAKPEITTAVRGPYYFVYIQKQGPFSEIPQAQKQASRLFKEQNLTKGIGCGEYLDNPSKVAQENLRWRVGYLVPDSIAVTEPLHYEKIAKHLYVIGSIKAHPMVAPLKTYPALEKWINKNPYKFVGMAYELYRPGGVVEVLFPIEKK